MRAKTLVLLGVAATGAAALGAGSQTWISFMLDGTHSLETATGHDLNAALSPISIALVAAALALTIAGPVFRRILGAIIALLGAGTVVLVAGVIGDPLAALGGRITDLTGISGSSNASYVSWHQVSAWPAVAIACGAVAAVLGLVTALLSGRWSAGGRKYDASARAQAGRGGAPDRISEWDALSDGDDPTTSDP